MQIDVYRIFWFYKQLDHIFNNKYVWKDGSNHIYGNIA